MPQLNLYVPEELIKSLKRESEKEGLSLSSYVTQLLSKFSSPQWNKEFLEVLGTWEGEFPEITLQKNEKRIKI